jgi:L-histidine N-alpha-methyltransferase
MYAQRTQPTPSARARLNLIQVPPAASPDFKQTVEEGLAAPQKHTPARFFYDQAGSDLFEKITKLPEYYLTRCEREILAQYADEIVDAVGPVIEIVEFGSGSSCKTRSLLDAAEGQGHLHYVPIDISGEFLRAASISLLEEYPGLEITAVAAEYSDALNHLPRKRAPRLFIFLGSNIGNFETDEAISFLKAIAGKMDDSDRLLVGMDLVKDPSIIEPAYNDSAGVTAAFNKNILRRINQELGADFDLDSFEHHAPFVKEHSRIEMRLVSTKDQDVHIPALDRTIHFKTGEFIHTENSHKFKELPLEGTGLRAVRSWTDSKQWFALTLLKLK